MLTSMPFFNKARIVAASDFLAASTSGNPAPAAPRFAAQSNDNIDQPHRSFRRMIVPPSIDLSSQKLADLASAVAEAVETDSNLLEQAQMDIRQWRRFLGFDVEGRLIAAGSASH